MKIQSVKVSVRLFLGFSLIVFLIVILGITSLFQYKTLSGFTEDMYAHPLAVSNAVRDIKVNIYKIQYNIMLMSNDIKSNKTGNLNNETYQLDENIIHDFELIYERFLGDKTDVDNAYGIYLEYQPELYETLVSLNSGKIITFEDHKNSDEVVDDLIRSIDIMGKFAFGKGDEFFTNAVKSSQDIFGFTIIFLSIIVILSIILGFIISLSITTPLNKLLSYVRKLSVGDQDFVIEDSGNDEIGRLANSVKALQVNLKEVVTTSKQIADGNYSGEIIPRSKSDELAISINKMSKSLISLESNNSYSDWIKTGVNLINEKMRGDQDLLELSSTVITTLSTYVEAKIGALYIFDDEKKDLKLYSSYAYSSRKSLNNKVSIGEGIIGQAALEGKIISITNIPEDYIEISSGLGNSLPRTIVAIPFSFNKKLKGVIELGSFKPFGEKEYDLFRNLENIIGVTFNSSETRESMRTLLVQQQEQANELVAQQEELRSANEELEEKTDRLTKSEMRMKQQQEELKAANEELEEKTEFLEKQSDVIGKKNSELEIVRDDITKKAKDLEISSKYKSEFLANMSHELRTPLNSLLILAKDLFNNKGNRLNDDDVKSAEIIYNSGNELLQLINEILDLAKIESGKTDLEIHNFSITNLETSILENFSALAADKGLGLEVIVGEKSPTFIRSDEQKINQILKNLLSNAIKFTHNGTITVTFSEPTVSTNDDKSLNSALLMIKVEDTGIGISKDKHKQIFDAFKQADGTTSREFGGTGLGLSISRELSVLLGGELLLDSKPNQGSIFTLLLPNLTEGNSYEELEDIRLKSDSLIEIKRNESKIIDDRENFEKSDNIILIIEDDENFASILKKNCNEHHFKTLISFTGEEGLKLAKQHRPNAIILDIKLPGINGLQVLDYLKKDSNTRHLPVHIISGDDKRAEVFDKGVLGFLQKPIDQNELDRLFEKIDRVINKKVKDLLIVEDDDNLRYSIEKLIGNGDVIRTCVSTGQEALRELSQNKFDCMILDLTLPDISGYDILRELDRMNLKHKPPVIIYTGKEISLEEEYELRKYSSSIIIKGVHSQERLLDETSLFLHRVIGNLSEHKQNMISKVYDEESVFKDKRILIVDDDMRNIFAVSKIIEERGMIVHKAVNGKKAIEFLDTDPNIDLVLMDIMMPVMDGYEAMKEIRKNIKFDNLPVIALTAKAMKDDRNKCIKAGANDYMTKPIDPERLLSLMRVWLYK
jgi:CheY-like chemotaxis protein/signal transduction histidine kinase/HAMP domain-containing protein